WGDRIAWAAGGVASPAGIRQDRRSTTRVTALAHIATPAWPCAALSGVQPRLRARVWVQAARPLDGRSAVHQTVTRRPVRLPRRASTAHRTGPAATPRTCAPHTTATAAGGPP